MSTAKATKSSKSINIYDVELKAKNKMDTSAFDYYRSGSDDEITLGENELAFRRLRFLPRVFRRIQNDQVDFSVKILNHTLSMPIMIAPTAMQRLAHSQEGEKGMYEAASRTGTLMCVSTLATTAIEDIQRYSHRNHPQQQQQQQQQQQYHHHHQYEAPRWFQVYVFRDRQITERLVKRAARDGYQALVLTADTPVIGRREADIRNGFTLPSHIHLENFRDNMDTYHHQFHSGEKQSSSGFGNYAATNFDRCLSWRDVVWLKRISHLPVFVKGVLHPDDADLAMQHGADGVIVSNHGGRQLDGSVAAVDALPAIRRRVGRHRGGGGMVFLDGGIRRGTDILKALALGADAVMIGRPALWGLAVDGSDGVVEVLEILRREFETAMMICGYRTISDIQSDIIVKDNYYFHNQLNEFNNSIISRL